MNEDSSMTQEQELAYRKGEGAFCCGKKFIANPFPEGSENYNYWAKGWFDQRKKACIQGKNHNN
jgi:hypothetical protein